MIRCSRYLFIALCSYAIRGRLLIMDDIGLNDGLTKNRNIHNGPQQPIKLHSQPTQANAPSYRPMAPVNQNVAQLQHILSQTMHSPVGTPNRIMPTALPAPPVEMLSYDDLNNVESEPSWEKDGESNQNDKLEPQILLGQPSNPGNKQTDGPPVSVHTERESTSMSKLLADVLTSTKEASSKVQTPRSTSVKEPITVTATSISTVTSTVSASSLGRSPVPATARISVAPKLTREEQDILQSYAKDHSSNIENASSARKSFLAMKIAEYKNINRENESKLGSLKSLYREYLERRERVGADISQMKTDTATAKSIVENTGGAIAKLEDGIEETSAQKRLEDREIVRLNKALNEEKNRQQMLKEKLTMYKGRLEKLRIERTENAAQLRSGIGKLGVYKKMDASLAGELRTIRENIEEVENMKNKGLDALDKLEIEYTQYENDTHAPLFIRYT